MKIVFMGTPDFAVPALERLIQDGHDITAVYCQPPRASGRGHKLTKSAVHLCAESHGLNVKTPINFKEESDKQELRDLSPDMIIVAAYGLILPQSVLDIPPLGCINIHGSLLPRWRGAAPIHRAILAGDTTTGITIMRMEKGLDTGPMLLGDSLSINPDDTVRSLHDALSNMGADLISQYVSNHEQYPSQTQPEDGITYAHKIEKCEGDLKGTESADMIDKMVRAFTPWPGVWFIHNDQKFKILDGFERVGNSATGEFGDILPQDDNYGFLCDYSEEPLRSVYQITQLQAPNGKKMDITSAINGGLIKCVTS